MDYLPFLDRLWRVPFLDMHGSTHYFIHMSKLLAIET